MSHITRHVLVTSDIARGLSGVYIRVHPRTEVDAAVIVNCIVWRRRWRRSTLGPVLVVIVRKTSFGLLTEENGEFEYTV